MEKNLKELLEAEQEVNRKVQAALNNKQNLLISIKPSAKRDIDNFRQQKEQEYKVEYEKLKKQINESNENKGEGHQQVTMEQIEKDYSKNKDRVIELLVSNVLSVNIEIPKVVKGAFWFLCYKIHRDIAYP